MLERMSEFYPIWAYESEMTQKTLDNLTDASLGHVAYPDGRTIGRLAWHIVQTVPEMMGRTGLAVLGPHEHDPVPSAAATIGEAYKVASASLVEQLTANWTDATLQLTDDMYGEQWPRHQTISALVLHQVHHRGQLTVLMRQVGLPVPGIYGPTRDEWVAMGIPAPEI